MHLTDEQFLVQFELARERIADAYCVMATTTDVGVRNGQFVLLSQWLEDLQELYNNHRDQWNRLVI